MMMRALCMVALIATVSGLKTGKKGGGGHWKKRTERSGTPVQIVTFATPYRLQTSFARVQPQSLVSTIESDFEQKGFEPLANLGDGKVWTGNYQEKITFLKNFMKKPENKDKIIAFVDGEDVIMG